MTLYLVRSQCMGSVRRENNCEYGGHCNALWMREIVQGGPCPGTNRWHFQLGRAAA